MTKFWENRLSKVPSSLLAAICVTAMIGCTDTDDTTGNNSFLPGEQTMFTTKVDEQRFDTQTMRVDSVALNNLTGLSDTNAQEYCAYLGSIVTPQEGQINFGMVTAASPYYVLFNDKEDKTGYSEDKPFGSDVKIDSAFLYLSVKFRGDLGREYKVTAYELNKDVVNMTDTYYSNFKVEDYINTTPICEAVVENGKSILLPLSLDYVKKFMEDKASFYKDVASYRKKFNGFYIKTSAVSEGEVFNRVIIDESGIEIFYHNKNAKADTTRHRVSFSHTTYDSWYNAEITVGKVFQTITRNFDLKDPSLGVKYDDKNADAAINKKYGYASSMSGLQTRLTVSDEIINKLKNEIESRGGKRVVVLRADFNVPTGSTSPSVLNNAMAAVGAYEQYGYTILLPDYASNKLDEQFGGKLNRSQNRYEFNMPAFVQNLLNKSLLGVKIEDKERSFYIAPGRDYKEDTFVPVASFENSDEHPITLTLTYSVVK